MSIKLRDRLRTNYDRFFPERQIYFRSRGEVRFVSIAPRLQVSIGLLAAGILIWISYSTLHVLSRDAALVEKDRQITKITQAYNALSTELEAVERGVVEKAASLEERQGYLGQLLASLRASLADTEGERPQNEAATDKEANAAGSPDIDTRLSAIESRQLALAAELIGLTRYQIASIDDAIAPTGLTTDDLLSHLNGENSAVGGPLIPIGYGLGMGPHMEIGDAEADPFSMLEAGFERLEAIETALGSFPALLPTDQYYVSSRFGRRRDPLRKVWSMHYGVDMAGWPRTPIRAAGDGMVTKAGVYGPYGRFIEIDHGNGFKTRYGHMRKLSAAKGDRVSGGQQIGEMGSTGRATSTHLHYEVWFAGKPLDPLSFMKASRHVLKIQGRNSDD